MSKEKDYLDKIEVHRQEVELDEVSRRRTRTRSSRKQNKAQKSPIMKTLVVIFIFIPLGLLGYVWLFYEPEVEKATPATDNSIVHIEKNNTPAASSNMEEKDEDEKDKNNEGQDSSNNSSNGSSNEVEVNEEEEQAIAKAAAEAENKLKEQQQQQKEDEEANEQSSNTSNGKTHVVGANDTLFSIAMKYYKDPTKVDAIKKANNLSTDSIPLGKALILP